MAVTVRFGYRSSEVRLAECTSAEQVGHFVCIAGDPPNGYDLVTRADPSDYGKMPAVGVIIDKPETDRALVQWFGETPEIFNGLSSGEYYFVGADAYIAEHSPTPTPGVTARAQVVGVATSPKRVYLSGNYRAHGRRL